MAEVDLKQALATGLSELKNVPEDATSADATRQVLTSMNASVLKTRFHLPDGLARTIGAGIAKMNPLVTAHELLWGNKKRKGGPSSENSPSM